MLALVIAALLVTGIAGAAMVGRSLVYRIECGMNLRGLGSAIIVYASYNGDKYPTADRWCDLLIQAGAITENSFSCPANGEGKCDYAMNPEAECNSPPDVVLLFETKRGWNQFGGAALLTFERHKLFGSGGCNLLFNNGDVKYVKKADLSKLRWRLTDTGSAPDIHHLVWKGDLDKVKSLLAEKPEEVNEKNIFNWTPLHTAALAGHTDIVALLLANGARGDADDRGETPMHAAAAKGHKDIVELLLAAGMNPNCRNLARITPLHEAVIGGHKEVVELLIANGAEVNARDDTGNTPLWYVDEHGEKEIADLLRRHGAVK